MGKKKSVVIDDSVVEEKKKTKPTAERAGIQLADTIEDVVETLEVGASEEVEAETKPNKDTKEGKVSKRATKKFVARKSNHSEKYRQSSEAVERSKRYSVLDAVEKAKATSYSKFDGSMEIHMNTAQKNMRGLVSLPFASG